MNWFWAMNAHEPFVSPARKTSGYQGTPKRAAREVERAWFEAIKDSPLERADAAVAAVNAYAAAKGRG